LVKFETSFLWQYRVKGNWRKKEMRKVMAPPPWKIMKNRVEA